MALKDLISNQKIDMEALRKAYLLAVEKPSLAASIVGELEKIKPPTALVLAYWAALWTLHANTFFNPFEKLTKVQEAQRLFSQAVAQAPDGVEVRFMRFSIQNALPSFLNLSPDLQADRLMIVANIDNQENKLMGNENLNRLINFMLTCGRCTPDEKKYLLSHATFDI